MNKDAPIPARQILETTLMGCAIDFAVAMEKKNVPLMHQIKKSVIMILEADPDWAKEIMLRQKKAWGQIEEDMDRNRNGQPPITPGITKI